MGASLQGGGGGGGGGRRRRARRHAPMSEINVTPFVDVMLVLLIIFMVAAPLLQAGVPLDLPSVAGKELPTPAKEPVVVSVTQKGEVFLQSEAERAVPPEQLVKQLEVIFKQRGGSREDAVFVRGHKGVEYEKVVRVLSILKSAGFSKVSLVTTPEGRS